MDTRVRAGTDSWTSSGREQLLPMILSSRDADWTRRCACPLLPVLPLQPRPSQSQRRMLMST